MGDYVDAKPPPIRRHSITAPRPKRKTPITPRKQQALGREENIANNDEARKKAIAKTLAKAEAERLAREGEKRRKAIAAKDVNQSLHPKNIIYYEDEKPITSTFEMDESERNKFYNEGISGVELERMEEELHIQDRGFDRGNLFLYYCINFICENRIRMKDLHVYHKRYFPRFKHYNLYKTIGKAENINSHHYQQIKLNENIKPPKTNNLNKSGERIANMHTFFVDCDGIPFEEFVSSRPNFISQKIFSTVELIRYFFRSVDEWMIGDVKFIGIVHPNAEGVEFSGLENSITLEQARPNICFSAIGYGYKLPQAYSSQKDFLNNFEDEILAKLKTNMSSNCKDLMDQFNESTNLRNTTYCENQSISAYISKANNNPNSSKLSDICNKLNTHMIKDVFTKTNFVTLYRVKKVDSEHITIEKEPLEAPARKSLDKKLDAMIARLKN